jgi:predicted nucleic acid-binding protein
MKVLLDSNILLRLSEPDHPQHAKAIAALERLGDQQHGLYVVPQNLYEFWVVATRPQSENGLGFTPQQAQTELNEICVLFTLLRDERAILDRWRNLVASLGIIGKNGHDARLVAAVERHALSHILTFNASDFARFPHITVITADAALQQ